MTRIITAALCCAALVLAAFAGTAQAQDDCDYDSLVAGTCTTALDYPTIDNINTPPTDEAIIGVVTPQRITTVTGTPPATSVDAPQIAFTGAETSVLTYAGAGLIAFGAVALGARRKIDQ